MAFNIKNLLTNNKSNNTVLILVSITIVVFTILVSWYLLSGEEEDGGNGKSKEDNTTPESESKKNITMPFISYSDDAYVKTITPTNDAEALSSSSLISNNSYLGGPTSTYEIEKYEYENKDIEKILSKNVKISFKWKNTSGFTNVKKLTFKRYVFDETMNKTGPLSGGELTYDTSGTGHSIDTYVITRPVSNSDANMKYFTNFGESDLDITFDNDTNSVPGVLSTCTEYVDTINDGMTECLKNNLYNVIGRNYITVKAQYVEDPAYPNDIAEKYLYKGGDGIPIQTEDLDMSLRIISPMTQTFSPDTSSQTVGKEYTQIKYKLEFGNAERHNVQLENDPTTGNAYVYFKIDTNYFYIDDNNTLKTDGTSTNKKLFTLIQPNKDDDGDTTYRIIRVGDGSSGNEYRYATLDGSNNIVFKKQSEINTETLWDNMNVGFTKQ